MDEDGVCKRQTPWQRLPPATPSDLRIRVLAPVEASDVPISCLGAFPVTAAWVGQGHKGLDGSLTRRLPCQSPARTSRLVDIVTTNRSAPARPRHLATPLCFAIHITTAPWRPFATLLCLCLFLSTAAA